MPGGRQIAEGSLAAYDVVLWGPFLLAVAASGALPVAMAAKLRAGAMLTIGAGLVRSATAFADAKPEGVQRQKAAAGDLSGAFGGFFEGT